jgi:hypothetical protein
MEETICEIGKTILRESSTQVFVSGAQKRTPFVRAVF